jgi:IclR family mhp operon transcriptional activator
MAIMGFVLWLGRTEYPSVPPLQARRVFRQVQNLHMPTSTFPPASAYWPVQGLLRGLDILRVLNQAPTGLASITEISRETGLHRTTVKRLLETLLQAGFVRRSADNGSYRLTFRVRELSAGFQDDAWVTEAARPSLRELTDKVLWPSDLVTLEGDQLVVRESTHPVSPLSFRGDAFGARMPLLSTAVGRAYLSYCREEEREALLMVLRSRDDEEAALARDAAYVEAFIERTRRDGYAVSESAERPGASRFGAIAVPVRRGRDVLACLNVVYLQRATTAAVLAVRALAPLKAAAARIEREIAAVTQGGDQG